MAQKPTPLRSVTYSSLQDILDDVLQLAQAPDLKIGGNLTAAQNIDHVRRAITISRVGTAVKAPLWLRLLGKILKGGLGSKPVSSGFKIPAKLAAEFIPPATITLQEAVDNLKAEIALAKVPGSMNQASPVFGVLSHEKWNALHLRHAELHLNFIAPASQ